MAMNVEHLACASTISDRLSWKTAEELEHNNEYEEEMEESDDDSDFDKKKYKIFLEIVMIDKLTRHFPMISWFQIST